jgi:hypothetical protein
MTSGISMRGPPPSSSPWALELLLDDTQTVMDVSAHRIGSAAHAYGDVRRTVRLTCLLGGAGVGGSHRRAERDLRGRWGGGDGRSGWAGGGHAHHGDSQAQTSIVTCVQTAA